MDLQGIEPWTTPMLREYYTTKPQALLVVERVGLGLVERQANNVRVGSTWRHSGVCRDVEGMKGARTALILEELIDCLI